MADELSLGERVLGSLLDRSHALRPDEIPGATRQSAVELGAAEAGIFLADLEQRVLLPFGTEGDRLDIDGTVAGRAFRTREVVDTGSERWVPLLDGADRLGVIRFALRPDAGDVLRTRLDWLTSVVAELVVTKSAYGDVIHRHRRTTPLSLASELRWALLPPLTFRNDVVEIAATLEPAYEVAGDGFDYAVGPETVHAAIFDAMGHGLEATRMANLAIATYRHARRHGGALPDLVTATDRVLADQFGPERFVTTVMVELDLRTGAVQLVSSGHPLPLLLRGTHVVGAVTGPVNVPLGLGIDRPSVIELALEPGDRLLLYSDGVTEARAADGSLFGLDRLRELVERAAMSAELPAETVRRLTHRVLEHAGSLQDDATLLLLGWPAPLQ